MTEKSKRKRALILEKSRELFREKGFNAVNMQDVVEACGISRGGVYVYFSSVDELFLAVIEQRNAEKMAQARKDAHRAASFNDILNGYLRRQKKRLLNIRHSLSLAMYEYCLSHSGEEYRSFFARQQEATKANVLEVLRCYGPMHEKDLQALAAHIMYVIEGLTAMGLFSGLAPEEIDRQFRILRDTIFAILKRSNYNVGTTAAANPAPAPAPQAVPVPDPEPRPVLNTTGNSGDFLLYTSWLSTQHRGRGGNDTGHDSGDSNGFDDGDETW